MRIGIDIQPLQTGTRYGGVGRYLYNVLTALAAQAGEHTYTLWLNSADYLEPVENLPTTWARVQVPRKRRLGRFWWCWDMVYLPYACARQHIDVYHYNSLSETEPMAPPFPLGKQKVVATIHDVIPLKLPELYPNEVHYSWWNFNFSAKFRRLRQANAILTVSECSKQDIAECLNYPNDQIFVAYNGVASEFFQKPSSEMLAQLRQKYGFSGPFILYLGGYYSARKNLDRLLDAYALLRQHHFPESCPPLILAGLSNRDHHAQIQTMLIEKRLTEHVRCLPHLPDAELPGLYRLATLFVYPSLYEGFGLPVAEALACGTVAAISNCSSLPEIAGAVALYFNPYDPQEIAHTMYEGLTNLSLRQRLQMQGPAQVARFSWQHTARTILEVYQYVYNGL